MEDDWLVYTVDDQRHRVRLDDGALVVQSWDDDWDEWDSATIDTGALATKFLIHTLENGLPTAGPAPAGAPAGVTTEQPASEPARAAAPAAPRGPIEIEPPAAAAPAPPAPSGPIEFTLADEQDEPEGPSDLDHIVEALKAEAAENGQPILSYPRLGFRLSSAGVNARALAAAVEAGEASGALVVTRKGRSNSSWKVSLP